jgi:hypothetical protein
MTAVQLQEAHSTLDVTIISWNRPPLVFLLPLGPVSFGTAKFVWVFINMTLSGGDGWDWHSPV